MNKSQSLTKTCSICGLQKPLSAFLQIAGAEGATYSNVCAACRGAGLDKETIKEQDESTTSTTGVKIDSKSKVKSEADKRQFRHDAEEQYHAEREENEIIETHEAEKKEILFEKERKHRDTFLTNRPFITSNKTIDAQRAAETKTTIEKAAHRAFGIDQSTKKDQAVRADQKEKEIDYSTGPFLDTQIAGKQKFTQGIAAKEGIVAKEGIMAKNKASVGGQFASWAKPVTPNKDGKKTDQQIISEYIEKNTGPGRKR